MPLGWPISVSYSRFCLPGKAWPEVGHTSKTHAASRASAQSAFAQLHHPDHAVSVLQGEEEPTGSGSEVVTDRGAIRVNVDKLIGRDNTFFVGVPLNIKDANGMLVRPVAFIY